jgi:uridine kinase
MSDARNRSVAAIRDAIAARADRPLVVALDGRSGTGKSTLARLLRSSVDAALVEADLFYRDMPDDQRAALTPEEGVARYFDWERLRDEALIPLRRGRTAQFCPFDWQRGSGLASPVTVEPRPLVIVEGVYSARPEFDGLVDLRVLIEVDQHQRQARLRKRSHDPAGWTTRWEAAEDVYFRRIRPPASFHLRVRGDTGGPTRAARSPA